MKRVLSIILMLMLVVCTCLNGTERVDASVITEDGKFEYEVIEDEGEVHITKYLDRQATNVVIPSEIAGKPVTWIDDYALEDCANLTSIDIPNSVRIIGDSAFKGCKSLMSIEIPNSVRTISYFAFRDCDGLTDITIPQSVMFILHHAFHGCDNLTSIKVDKDNPKFDSRDNCNAIIATETNELISGCKTTVIPSSVTSIGTGAFADCGGLTDITIPSSVTSISGNVFWGCDNLTSIKVDKDNPKFDSRDNCNAIIATETNELISGCKTTVIPSNVTSIGTDAFADCSGLKDITIPSSVTSIGDYAFEDCSGLTNITIPSSVTSIAGNVFGGCDGLKSIKVDKDNPKFDSRDNCNAIIATETNELISGCKTTVIPSSVTSIGINAFVGCSGLTNITIPSSVTSIGNQAFADCSGLTDINIPNSVTSIGVLAFRSCVKLKSIIIPDSVTSIRDGAFHDCKNLTSLVIPKSVTSIGYDIISKCNNLTTIYITKGSAIDKYIKDHKITKEVRDIEELKAKPVPKTQIAPAGKVEPKAQNISVAKIKSYKAKKLRKKKVSFSLKAKSSGDGKLTYSVKKTSKKIRKYIKVSKSGKVTLKKKAKKGTYKILITAAQTSNYKKATKLVKIKVK